jgi:alpha-tubulin suppressor-like RCC1 family protein
VDVSGLTSGVSAISAGGFYTCALMTQTGGVKCWGENSFGNLGNNTFTESNVPVDVWELESGVIAISAGYAHACAVTVAGGAKCWGYNGNGGLGNGSSDYMSQVPVDVAGLAAGVSFISAGTDHTCAVTQAGAVKCWGDNTYGELGDGTTTGSLVPVDVPDLASGVSALSAGTDHTCALTQAGGIKCWGADEADDMSHIPVDVNGLADGVSALTVGHYHACVLLQSGGGKCWGSNSYGQLGDGTTNLRMIPVDVVWFP